MKYKQITTEERHIISFLRAQRLSPREIAKLLDRHRSTIYREYRRNESKYGVYRAEKAAEKTNGRRRRSRKNPQYSDEEFALVVELLELKFSPDQISNTLRLNRKLRISHETIYRYIWYDKKNGGKWYKHLRQATKKRRKRHNSYDRRGIMTGKRPIEQRPIAATMRSRRGHLEADTVLGKGSKHCILTMVDRKTGYLFIRKLRNRTTKEVYRAMRVILRNDKYTIRTITPDNGTEFHQFRRIEKDTGVEFYFPPPYQSWARGTNENTNGLIRQYLPKGTSMTRLTQVECNHIARELNRRPRRRYGFRTPEELYV
jgi:IS30 family transposase